MCSWTAHSFFLSFVRSLLLSHSFDSIFFLHSLSQLFLFSKVVCILKSLNKKQNVWARALAMFCEWIITKFVLLSLYALSFGCYYYCVTFLRLHLFFHILCPLSVGRANSHLCLLHFPTYINWNIYCALFFSFHFILNHHADVPFLYF